MGIQQVCEYDQTIPQPHTEEQPMAPKEKTRIINSHMSLRSSILKEDACKIRKDNMYCIMKQGYNTTPFPPHTPKFTPLLFLTN